MGLRGRQLQIDMEQTETFNFDTFTAEECARMYKRVIVEKQNTYYSEKAETILKLLFSFVLDGNEPELIFPHDGEIEQKVLDIITQKGFTIHPYSFSGYQCPSKYIIRLPKLIQTIFNECENERV